MRPDWDSFRRSHLTPFRHLPKKTLVSRSQFRNCFLLLREDLQKRKNEKSWLDCFFSDHTNERTTVLGSRLNCICSTDCDFSTVEYVYTHVCIGASVSTMLILKIMGLVIFIISIRTRHLFGGATLCKQQQQSFEWRLHTSPAAAAEDWNYLCPRHSIHLHHRGILYFHPQRNIMIYLHGVAHSHDLLIKLSPSVSEMWWWGIGEWQRRDHNKNDVQSAQL